MSSGMVGLEQWNLVYEGSVKRVFKRPGSDSLLFEFTDDYSVFDWGKMPDTIENKGKSLVVLGAFFFEKLAQPRFWQKLADHPSLNKLKNDWVGERLSHRVFKRLQTEGVAHHYRRLLKESGGTVSWRKSAGCTEKLLLEVAGAQVQHLQPGTVCGQAVYYYDTTAKLARRLIPLEVVFRFGMPEGSSLQARLQSDPDYARRLGLASTPKAKTMFDRPVIEFFTKLEPSDRILSVQEALLISRLTIAGFNDLVELGFDLALALFTIFADVGIELWDGKFEFITDGAALLLADSIGPDELRLIYQGKQLSKEMLRQVYRNGPWELAVREAKQIALVQGAGNFKTICTTRLKRQPARLPVEIKRCADSLYPVLVNAVTNTSVFAEQPTLEQFANSMPSLEVGL